MDEEIKYERKVFSFASKREYWRIKTNFIMGIIIAFVLSILLIILTIYFLNIDNKVEMYSTLFILFISLFMIYTVFMSYKYLKFFISEVLVTDSRLEMTVYHYNKLYKQYDLNIKEVVCICEDTGKSFDIYIKHQNNIIAAQSCNEGSWTKEKVYKLYKAIKEGKGEKYKKIKSMEN